MVPGGPAGSPNPEGSTAAVPGDAASQSIMSGASGAPSTRTHSPTQPGPEQPPTLARNPLHARSAASASNHGRVSPVRSASIVPGAREREIPHTPPLVEAADAEEDISIGASRLWCLAVLAAIVLAVLVAYSVCVAASRHEEHAMVPVREAAMEVMRAAAVQQLAIAAEEGALVALVLAADGCEVVDGPAFRQHVRGLESDSMVREGVLAWVPAVPAALRTAWAADYGVAAIDDADDGNPIFEAAGMHYTVHHAVPRGGTPTEVADAFVGYDLGAVPAVRLVFQNMTAGLAEGRAEVDVAVAMFDFDPAGSGFAGTPWYLVITPVPAEAVAHVCLEDSGVVPADVPRAVDFVVGAYSLDTLVHDAAARAQAPGLRGDIHPDLSGVGSCSDTNGTPGTARAFPIPTGAGRHAGTWCLDIDTTASFEARYTTIAPYVVSALVGVYVLGASALVVVSLCRRQRLSKVSGVCLGILHHLSECVGTMEFASFDFLWRLPENAPPMLVAYRDVVEVFKDYKKVIPQAVLDMQEEMGVSLSPGRMSIANQPDTNEAEESEWWSTPSTVPLRVRAGSATPSSTHGASFIAQSDSGAPSPLPLADGELAAPLRAAPRSAMPAGARPRTSASTDGAASHPDQRRVSQGKSRRNRTAARARRSSSAVFFQKLANAKEVSSPPEPTASSSAGAGLGMHLTRVALMKIAVAARPLHLPGDPAAGNDNAVADLTTEHIANFSHFTHATAKRAQGRVYTVLGDCAVLSFSGALEACRVAKSYVHEQQDLRMWIGLSQGRVAAGTVGDDSHRHALVAGPVVKEAEALCGIARALGFDCLGTEVVRGGCVPVERFLYVDTFFREKIGVHWQPMDVGEDTARAAGLSAPAARMRAHQLVAYSLVIDADQAINRDLSPTGNEEEWMYNIEQGSAKENPTINTVEEACKKMKMGDLATATTMFEALPPDVSSWRIVRHHRIRLSGNPQYALQHGMVDVDINPDGCTSLRGLSSYLSNSMASEAITPNPAFAPTSPADTYEASLPKMISSAPPTPSIELEVEVGVERQKTVSFRHNRGSASVEDTPLRPTPIPQNPVLLERFGAPRAAAPLDSPALGSETSGPLPPVKRYRSESEERGAPRQPQPLPRLDMTRGGLPPAVLKREAHTPTFTTPTATTPTVNTPTALAPTLNTATGTTSAANTPVVEESSK